MARVKMTSPPSSRQARDHGRATEPEHARLFLAAREAATGGDVARPEDRADGRARYIYR